MADHREPPDATDNRNHARRREARAQEHASAPARLIHPHPQPLGPPMLTIQGRTALGWIPAALVCAAQSALSWRVTILTTPLHHRIARSQASAPTATSAPSGTSTD